MSRTITPTQQLVDQLVDVYLSWREESCAVDRAYDRWRAAESEDRASAYAAYRAQLDLEEHAARCYQCCIEAFPESEELLAAA